MSAYYVLVTAVGAWHNQWSEEHIRRGDGSCCSASVVRVVAAYGVVILDESKWKVSPSVSQLESLDNI